MIGSVSKLTTPNERFTLSLLLAVIIHAVVIFGVGFSHSVALKKKPSSLEVVLVQAEYREAPNRAIRIAQANQQASGTTHIENDLSNKVTHSNPPSFAEITHGSADASEVGPSHRDTHTLSLQRTIDQIPADELYPPSPDATIPERITQAQRNLEIAKLTAELSQSQRQYTKPPRIHYIDTVSAKTAPEAAFIKAWVEKVERIGNLNYPEQARHQHLHGSVILHVLLNKDGSVEKVQIGSASGKQILDNAAIRSVKLASPFPPFPEAMRNDYDQLMITRTWVFQANDSLETR